jgi:hypothetical protein
VMADNHRFPEKKVSNFERLPSAMLINVSIAMNVFLLFPMNELNCQRAYKIECLN